MCCSKKDVLIVSSISVRIWICEASLHIYINSHLPNYTKRENLIESFYNHIIYSMWLHLLIIQFGKLVIVEMNDNVPQIMSFLYILDFNVLQLAYRCGVYSFLSSELLWRTICLQCFLRYSRATASKVVLAVPTGRCSGQWDTPMEGRAL